MSATRKREVVISDARMLYPSKVGSSIRYALSAYLLEGNRNVDLQIWLTDCDRSIRWGAWGHAGFEEMREKTHAAIEMLQGALKGMDFIEAHYNKLPTRKRKSK
jgi:hypothetical protein